VSARFSGQSTVARHRMIYQALGSLMQHPIHALAITARSPEETKGKQ
jgi:BolA family transcriptional regulator, general stress-responsive regulator